MAGVAHVICVRIMSPVPAKTSEGRRAPEHAQSAEQISAEESGRKAALLKWAVETADQVIAAALADAALHFLEGDSGDDEQFGSLDLMGDYDPIIDSKTGSRLSEIIKQAAETFRTKTFRTSEKMLKRVYLNTLRDRWEQHKEQNKQIPSEPVGKFYGRSPYMTNRHGVWVRLNTGGLDDLNVGRRIAKTCVEPEALSYDTTPQRNWQHRYLVTGELGQLIVDIPAEHLGKDATRAINTLMRRGGVRPVESRQARQHFARFLRLPPRKRIVRAPRTGWFEWRGHLVFVLPDEVLGATDKLHIALDDTTPSGSHGFHRAGTSEQWRQQVAFPLARHSNVVLAVGTMLAGPLLCWADEPGGGFHFFGGSKVGKTLATAIGQSVWGKPFIPGSNTSNTFGYDWDSTPGRLEQRAVLRSDVGLSLDGIERGDAKAIAPSIYTFSSGQGRGRMGRSEAAFNLTVISSGEVSVAKFLGDARAGQTVRLSDIPAEVEPGSGSAFEQFRPDAAGKKFYALTREYHGAVGYDWLQYLVGQTPKNFQPRLNELCKVFLRQPAVVEILDRAHSQVISVIHRFALVAATLALAIEASILPWSQVDTDAAIIACMQRWLNQRGNIDVAGELLREIERRRRMFAVTANDRLIHLDIVERQLVAASPADQRKMEAAERFDGFFKNGRAIDEGRVLLTPDAWRHLWAGLDLEAVKQHLLRRGLLIPGRDGKVPSAEKYKSGAPTARFYVLAAAFINRETA